MSQIMIRLIVMREITRVKWNKRDVLQGGNTSASIFLLYFSCLCIYF